MTDWRESYDEARRVAYGSHERLRALQQALDGADAVNEVDGAFEIRLDIVETAYYSGDPIPALSAFAWCLARWDDDRDRFARHSYTMGWRHKWMPVWAMGFPAVAAARLEAMVDDLERRHVADGAGRRQALGVRLQLALDTGIGDPVGDLLGEWRASARSSLSDCAACEQLLEARSLVALGQPDEALAVLSPLLTGSASFCADGPEEVLALSVPLLISAGQPGDAAEAFRRGIRNSREDARKQVSVARLLAAAARGGEHKRLPPLVAGTIGLLDDAPSPHDEMSAAAAFARALAALDADVEVLATTAVPTVLIGDGDPAELTTAGALGAALAAHARSLAGAFDERNGNGIATAQVDAHLASPDLETVGLFHIGAKRPKAAKARAASTDPQLPFDEPVEPVESVESVAPLVTPEEAVERCRALLAEAEAHDDPLAPSTLALVREAIQAVRDHGTTEALADARRAMGRLLAFGGRLDEAAVQLAEAAELYAELDEPMSAAGVLLSRAQVELALESHDRAVDLAGDALLAVGAARPEDIEDVGVRRRALAVHAELAAWDWDNEKAVGFLRPLIALDEAEGEDAFEHQVRLVRLLVRDEETDDALAALDSIVVGVEEPAREAEVAVLRAEVLLDGDRGADALSVADAAEPLVGAVGRPDLVRDLLVAGASAAWSAWVDTWGPDDAGTWDDEVREIVGGLPFPQRGDAVLRAEAFARNRAALEGLDALDAGLVDPRHRQAIEWRLDKEDDA